MTPVEASGLVFIVVATEQLDVQARSHGIRNRTNSNEHR